MKLGSKKSISPIYVIDITGTDPLSSGGGGVILKNLKNEIYLTYEGVIGSK